MDIKYYESGKNIILESKTFDVGATLNSGQCFRFINLSENEYILIARGRVLKIGAYPGRIIFYNTEIKEFEEIWRDYFDLSRDYFSIQSALTPDPVLAEAIAFSPGIRILNQEFFECLISFIISQNNRIPRIKNIVKNICERFGKEISDGFYSFPDAKALTDAGIDGLMECKLGFRAKYVFDAAKRVLDGELDKDELSKLDTLEIKDRLKEIKGVGDKVADCVLLFSFGRSEVFPTDVWVKRVMEHFYFKGENTSIKEIHKLAKDKYKENAGFAQQYLFYYARELKIGIDCRRVKN